MKVKVPNETHQYSLEMKFDANYEAVVTIYLCATECRNVSNAPLYFYSDQKILPPHAYRFDAGLNREFPSQLFILDMQQLLDHYKEEDLMQVSEKFCPIVIQIETVYP